MKGLPDLEAAMEVAILDCQKEPPVREMEAMEKEKAAAVPTHAVLRTLIFHHPG